ncbi:uncharacterized protein LOC119075616 [Bradysia coprophila]|uniref:uncharacterized protein LOC119075616 n=1 Tax=Bradysia coprophila TaxID=38358 RepID=UPI00187DA03F|nr:uncharacterized protein LOC119075616 [Bradysia coprophila]
MSKTIDFNKLKDGIIDAGTELVSKIIKDATDGAVTVQSIVNGQIKVDANAYVDKAVSLLNDKLESNNLDTSELPDVDVNFEHNVACGIIIPGTADIQDGSISGLANFCRTGDSELNINALSSPMISARARIGIRNTNVEYSGKVTLMCFGPQFKIMGILADISLDIDLVVEKNLVVTVNKFGVSSDGDLKLQFQNLDNFDYLPEKISQELKTGIKKTVLEYLENSMRERLETVISSLPLTA